MWYLLTTLGFFLALVAVIVLSICLGKKKEQLATMQKQAKRRARANKSIDSVRRMDESTVRTRLHKFADK